MRGQLGFLGLAVLFLVGACGAEDSPSVAGAWCGKQVTKAEDCRGDEVVLLQLTEAAGLSGQQCEAYQQDCYPLQGATLSGSTLTYFYTFDIYRVDAAFTVAGDGKTMSGALTSSKCNGCKSPKTLFKL
jgi:hypothetical protein